MSRMRWRSKSLGVSRSTRLRKRRNSRARCRGRQVPITFPSSSIEGSKERGGPVPVVVVGLPGGEALAEWQQRRRPVERLNLALLIDREHQGVVGRIEMSIGLSSR